MAFDDDIALTASSDGTLMGAISDRWTAPRGAHGGYVMAMLLHAMEVAIGDPARQPRSLSVHFLRPPKLGPLPADVAPPGEAAEPFPGAPPFAQRLALQPRFGDAPFSGSAKLEVGGWIDLREARPLDGPALCVLADGWYPVIWTRLTEFIPAPTIDLTVHFRAPLPVTGPLLARFRTNLARDGFFEEDGELWATDGTLVAQSRQLGLLLSPNR